MTFFNKVNNAATELNRLELAREAYYVSIEIADAAKAKYEKAIQMANREGSSHNKLLQDNAKNMFHRYNNALDAKLEAKEVYLAIRSEVMGYVSNIRL